MASSASSPTTSDDAETLREWLAEGPYTLVMSSSFFGTTFHIGVLAALVEAGFPPSAVAGSSAGAIVGALWSAGLSIDELVHSLASFSMSEVMHLARPWREPGGVFSSERTREMMHAMLKEHGARERLEDGRVPCHVSAFDAAGLCTRVVSRGDVADALAASMAVPGMFAPFWLNGRPHLDGGVADMPGIAGCDASSRILYHHCTIFPLCLTPLREATTPFASSVTLTIGGLPTLHPANFGARAVGAFETARDAARRALGCRLADRALGARRLAVRAHEPPRARL